MNYYLNGNIFFPTVCVTFLPHLYLVLKYNVALSPCLYAVNSALYHCDFNTDGVQSKQERVVWMFRYPLQKVPALSYFKVNIVMELKMLNCCAGIKDRLREETVLTNCTQP